LPYKSDIPTMRSILIKLVIQRFLQGVSALQHVRQICIGAGVLIAIVLQELIVLIQS
jgi:hypothetical protein